MSRWVEILQDWAQIAADKICDLQTHGEGSGPSPKLVAHRGAWDSQHLENSFSALKRAADLGAWAIEFDVHFTQDDVPVVNHDPDLMRGHGRTEQIRDLPWRELQRLAPALPSLETVLSIPVHRMIEIKTSMTPNQTVNLTRGLGRLQPLEDYHLLTLDSSLVRSHSALPERAWILVGDVNMGRLHAVARDMSLGGVAGHYLGFSRDRVDRLHADGLRAGSGFAPNKNLYRREWARGLDWVFTNRIADLV